MILEESIFGGYLVVNFSDPQSILGSNAFGLINQEAELRVKSYVYVRDEERAKQNGFSSSIFYLLIIFILQLFWFYGKGNF